MKKRIAFCAMALSALVSVAGDHTVSAVFNCENNTVALTFSGEMPVRDFVLCLKGGKAVMYDRVTKRYFGDLNNVGFVFSVATGGKVRFESLRVLNLR